MSQEVSTCLTARPTEARGDISRKPSGTGLSLSMTCSEALVWVVTVTVELVGMSCVLSCRLPLGSVSRCS